MFSLFWVLFWGGLVSLLVASAISLRARLKERLAHEEVRVDDDAIRSILQTGRLVTDDEPLDWQEIEEEERRFWSETWDEPDEW